jgi:lipoate-protein ligase A
MALDEAIAHEVMRNSAPPTLRLYGWQKPSVSLGRFQHSDNIDSDYCLKEGIPFVRRPTGGRGILHGLELTYSFSSGTGNRQFSCGPRDCYLKLGEAFLLAFQKLGLNVNMQLKKSASAPKDSRSPLCFQSTSYAEITVGGKKVIGSAQRRWPGGLLQQGSIPLTIDSPAINAVFRVEPSNESMAGLNEIMPSLLLKDLKETVIRAFQTVFGITLKESSPSREEESLALELLQRKYQLPEWNLQK